MPFLFSSGSRKKKSYIHNDDDAEESARRREMVKQKLYAEHMIDGDEDDCDDYLERRLNSRSPARRNSRRNSSIRRVAAPSYVDPSGSLRATSHNSVQFRGPPRRSFSEQNSRTTIGAMQRSAPRRPPPRSHSFANDTDNHLDEFVVTPNNNPRFSMAPHRPVRRQSRISQRTSSRRGSHVQGEEEDDNGEMMLVTGNQRKPPPRRRRNSVTVQTLESNADAATRIGPPRRKSHYSRSRSPESVTSIGMTENNFDFSEHSKSSKDCSEKSFCRGLFRRKSGNWDEDEESSTDRSSSFFGKIKRRNSSSLKISTKIDTSDHTLDSRFTSGSSTRSKEDIYNSAVHRAKERQAIKNAQNCMRNNGGSESFGNHPGRLTLSEQLSRLPPANDSDDDYDEDEDDGTESKSIFSSIVSKIENIYDDLS